MTKFDWMQVAGRPSITLGVVLLGATLMFSCGDGENTKDEVDGSDSNSSSAQNTGGQSASAQTCATDSDCGGGATCEFGQALSTRQQPLCDADETEVCTNDFGEACVPDGEDDPFCFCDCTPDIDDGGTGEQPDADESGSDTDGAPPQQTTGRCVGSQSTGSDSDTTTEVDENNSADDGGAGEALCVEFSTGSNSFVGDDVYTTCDGFPPQNCRTGGFIWFNGDQSECVCALRCDDFDPVRQPGEACDTNGDFVCQYLENASGTSKGNWCIPTSWDDDLDCSQ